MRRVEFRLWLPGDDRNHVIVRTLTDAKAAEVMEGESSRQWDHRWDDGSVAAITARLMVPGERAPESDGFRGYEWLVRNVIDYGSPYRTGTFEGAAGPRPTEPHEPVTYSGKIANCQAAIPSHKVGFRQCSNRPKFVIAVGDDREGDGRLAVCRRHVALSRRYTLIDWQRSIYARPGSMDRVEPEYQPAAPR